MTKTFKSNGSAFSALTLAENFLKAMGYSFGVLQGDRPVGVKKGDYFIGKWDKMTAADREVLSGSMTSADFRNGDVHLTIKEV